LAGAPPLSELTFKKSPELRQDVYIEGCRSAPWWLVVDYIVPVDGEYGAHRQRRRARDAVRSKLAIDGSAPSCSSSCRGRGPRRTIRCAAARRCHQPERAITDQGGPRHLTVAFLKTAGTPQVESDRQPFEGGRSKRRLRGTQGDIAD